ncbi:hypothetical protein N431DRAFT_24011 [Stipitochalara longipes BDJ]|nr:hypothetical protein N431DRAFT_24011 [Stipitochalara longipes BDJ]
MPISTPLLAPQPLIRGRDDVRRPGIILGFLAEKHPRLIRGPGRPGPFWIPSRVCSANLARAFDAFPSSPPSAAQRPRSIKWSPVVADTPPPKSLNADGSDLAAQGLILYPVRSAYQHCPLPARAQQHRSTSDSVTALTGCIQCCWITALTAVTSTCQRVAAKALQPPKP